MIDYRKCAVVPMMANLTGKVEFEILVYGYTARELSTAPNVVISSLARRHPDHTSSVFMLRDQRPYKDTWRPGDPVAVAPEVQPKRKRGKSTDAMAEHLQDLGDLAHPDIVQ